MRRTRAKWTMFSAITAGAQLRRRVQSASSSARARNSSSSLAVSPLCSLTMSSWYLSSTPSVSCTVDRVEADRVQRDQRVRPVDRLGDARRLEQVERAHALHELDDLHVQPLRRARRLQAHDLQLALDAREVDPVVQAAALQRVVDLARAVAGDDRDRRRARRWTVPSSGIVIWFSASTSSRKASKGSSARSSSSISSTGERVLRQRLQQRALDQHRRASTGSAPGARAAASPTSCAASARRISIIWRATFHS